MCFPAAALPFISAGMTAATSLVSFAGQQATANAQAAQWRQNQVNALAAARDTQNQLTMRQMQEGALTAQKLQASNIDEAQRQAQAETSGAASGIGGSVSLDNIINSIGRASEENRVTLMTNYNNTAAQLQTEKDAANDQYLSRVNSVSPGVQPNPLSLAVGIGNAGLGFANAQTKADLAAQGAGV